MKTKYSQIITLVFILLYSYFFPIQVLAYDTTIYQIQKNLSDLGYDPGPVDGIWSKKTENALKDFQRKNNLPESGEVNQETIMGLQIIKSISSSNQNPVNFSNEYVLEIDSIPIDVGKGKVFIKPGSKPDIIRVEIREGSYVAGPDGQLCLCCLEKINISPNMKFQTKIFTHMTLSGEKHQYNPFGEHFKLDKEFYEINNADLDFRITPQDTNDFIVVGSKGATLEKIGKGFKLIEGEAYFIRKSEDTDRK